MIMDKEYWEALRRMAYKKGYKTRNSLIVTALKMIVDREPEYLMAGLEDAKIRYVAREMEKPWKPPLNPPSEDTLKEIFGDELEEYGKESV